MRGKVSIKDVKQAVKRITPAYAGKRRTASTGTTSTRDHPRVCGEKIFHLGLALSSSGSPPRMRGKVALLGIDPTGARITPAYAGKR